VDIATAILSCWGRVWHLPDPRPDLAEFQEQTEAIHVFLSGPEAVEKLEVKRRRMDPGASSARHKRPIEFTNGHLQLQCLRGRWLVQNWRGEETAQYSWIAPEENLLSALIRPPCSGGRMHCICIKNEPTALAARSDRLDESANNDANDAIDTLQISQDPTSMRREWPHEITETIILYLRKMNWRTPFCGDCAPPTLNGR